MDHLISKYVQYKRELSSTNFDTFQHGVLILLIALVVIAVTFHYLEELITLIVTQGKQGYIDPFNLIIYLLAFIIIVIVNFKPATQVGVHLFLISFIFVAFRLHYKYDDYTMFTMLSIATVFLTGFLTNPIATLIYSSVIFIMFIAITQGQYGIDRYNSFSTILALITAFSFIFSFSIRKIFKNNERVTKKLQFLYDSDKRLFSYLTHKLKTPLTILQTELKSEHYKSSPQLQKTLQDINYAINEMGVFSKMNLSKISISKTEIDMDDLLTEIANDARILAKNYEQNHEVKRRVTYANTLSGNNHIIIGSRDNLKEALLNIIDNSIRHNPDRKTLDIDIKLTRKSNRYCIIIADNGAGISEEKLTEVLAHKSATNLSDGIPNHIGLQIVRNIIKAIGGEFQMYSKPNEGTRVEISLPIT